MIRRSYLFAPGHDERLVTKALDVGADAVILDLEDAVPAAAKQRARAVVAAVIETRPTVVRINAAGSPDAEADLAVVAEHALALRVPKCETPEQVAWVVARAPGVPLICAIESAVGLLAVVRLAGCPGVANLSIGGVDMRRDLGLGPGLLPGLHARSAIAVASRAAGLDAPVDSVFPDVRDLAGLREEAEFARSLGFFGKSAIHPAQLDVIHDVFTPTADELAWARAVTAGYSASGGAVTRLDSGEMVDVPVAARAHRLLELADSGRESGQRP